MHQRNQEYNHLSSTTTLRRSSHYGATEPKHRRVDPLNQDMEMRRYSVYSTFEKVDPKTWEGEVVDTRWVTAVKNKGTPDELFRARIVEKQFNTGTVQGLYPGTPDSVACRAMLARHRVGTLDAESAFLQSPRIPEEGLVATSNASCQKVKSILARSPSKCLSTSPIRSLCSLLLCVQACWPKTMCGWKATVTTRSLLLNIKMCLMRQH